MKSLLLVVLAVCLVAVIAEAPAAAGATGAAVVHHEHHHKHAHHHTHHHKGGVRHRAHPHHELSEHDRLDRLTHLEHHHLINHLDDEDHELRRLERERRAEIYQQHDITLDSDKKENLKKVKVFHGPEDRDDRRRAEALREFEREERDLEERRRHHHLLEPAFHHRPLLDNGREFLHHHIPHEYRHNICNGCPERVEVPPHLDPRNRVHHGKVIGRKKVLPVEPELRDRYTRREERIAERLARRELSLENHIRPEFYPLSREQRREVRAEYPNVAKILRRFPKSARMYPERHERRLYNPPEGWPETELDRILEHEHHRHDGHPHKHTHTHKHTHEKK